MLGPVPDIVAVWVRKSLEYRAGKDVLGIKGTS
jgi:hypothetical protein